MNMQEAKSIPEDLTTSSEKILEADELSIPIAELVTQLWKDTRIKDGLPNFYKNVQGGVDGATYYFENALRFSEESFMPTKADVLMARRKTVGIVETTFEFKGIIFTLVDVGGQRSERKKWLHCFNSVGAVLFLTAINEYDMVLEEDASTNRLLESLKLWKALSSSHFFQSTPFILFLNKSDLFKDKIQSKPLNLVFADFNDVVSKDEYKDMNNYEKSWRYILSQFKSHFEGTTFYSHITNNLDTELCKKVFFVIKETVIVSAVQGTTLV